MTGAAQLAPHSSQEAGLIQVAIADGPPEPLTYRYEGPAPAPGSRVRVPLGRRETAGFVVGHAEAPPAGVTRLRSASPLEGAPGVSDELLALTRRVAGYYLAPWGQVLAAAVPPAGRKGPLRLRTVRVARLICAPETARARAKELEVRAPRQAEALRLLVAEGEVPTARLAPSVANRLAQQGLVEILGRPERRTPLTENGASVGAEPVARLSTAQREALDHIVGTLGRFAPVLLHGVTGSGKTEVYLRAAEAAIGRGGEVLLLTPEIALASHLTVAARARFGGRVAVLHSGLSTGERTDEWERVSRGEASLVIGTRSAVFAPLQRLALIVVDEEHDGAYKQEESPRYHARDVALMRAQGSGVPVVLGSATPSLETFARARSGQYAYLTLSKRVRSGALPEVSVVDLRQERPERPGGVLTRPLLTALAETFERGEQALLLLNRRGYAPLILCRACGHTWRCRHCRVSLTFHRESRLLRCHYCDAREPAPSACPACGDRMPEAVGVGTEGLMAEVAERFPEARVARMDRDTTRTKDAHLRILRDMEAGNIDVLVGTQMIAKGHNLPGVTLVGVVCADQGIHVPDFRAAETAFALLAQVAGRAGRGERPGRVVLQTYDPRHPAVFHAMEHDYLAFSTAELELRGAVGFPPAGRVIRLVLRDRSERRLERACERLAELVNHRPAPQVEVLGPAPPCLAVLRDEHRRHLLIKGPETGPVRQVARWLLDGIARAPGLASLRVDVDVDPQNLM